MTNQTRRRRSGAPIMIDTVYRDAGGMRRAGVGTFVLPRDGEGFGVAGLAGVAEDHLPQVGVSLAERFGVMGLLHEEEEFAFGLRVEEQGSGADVRLSAICWVVTSSTPCSANSSLAAAVMRSSFCCSVRSRRPTGWEASSPTLRYMHSVTRRKKNHHALT